jgi:hypothetical protein
MIDYIRNLVAHWAFDPVYELVMAVLVALFGYMASLWFQRGRARRSMSRFLLRMARQAHLTAKKPPQTVSASKNGSDLGQREYFFFVFLVEQVQQRITVLAGETNTSRYGAHLDDVYEAARRLSESFEGTRQRSDDFWSNYNAFLDAILLAERRMRVLDRAGRREIDSLKH